MITKKNVIEFFHGIVHNNDLDVNKELLWGYFFLDSDKNKLIELFKKLEQECYSFVSLTEDSMLHDKDLKEYCLHVEKKEVHNVESLCFRNQEFYEIVAQNQIGYYDGFDVGNVE